MQAYEGDSNKGSIPNTRTFNIVSDSETPGVHGLLETLILNRIQISQIISIPASTKQHLLSYSIYSADSSKMFALLVKNLIWLVKI